MDCLSAELPLDGHLRRIQQSRDYGGFNLLAADRAGLCYCTNQRNGVTKLDPGVFGISNHFLDTPWPKVTIAKQGFQDALCQRDTAAMLEELFLMLQKRSGSSQAAVAVTVVDTAVDPGVYGRNTRVAHFEQPRFAWSWSPAGVPVSATTGCTIR